MTDSNNTFKKIGFASVIMMASVFLSRIIGIFREMAIGYVGGVSPDVDAYQVAFIIPEILNHILASGFLSITFIPIFTHYLVQKQEQEGYKVFSIILNTFGLLLIGCIAAAMIFAPRIVSLLAPGIHQGPTFDMAVKMTRIIIPAQFFFFTGGLLMAIQFAHDRFFIPALSGLIYNLFITLGGLLLGPYIGIEGFAWGVLAGAFFGNFALQFFGARKINARYYMIFSFNHPDLIRYVRLTIPLMFGLTMTFSVEFLFKFFGSYLEPGSIAAMNYSKVVLFALVGLFGQAVGVAAYPTMAKLAKDKDLSQLNQLLNNTLKFIFLVLPISVLFMVLNHEIVRILFQRGLFDVAATQMTAGILPFFLIGAFAFSAQNIVSRGYYAIQNTLFPVIFTTVCVIITLPVIWLLMKMMGAQGVALGLSITIAIQCFVLFECWNRQSRNTRKKQVYLFFFKMIPLSLALGLVLKVSADFFRTVFDPGSLIGCISIVVSTGLEFCLLFLLIGHLFGVHEIIEVKNRFVKKIRG